MFVKIWSLGLKRMVVPRLSFSPWTANVFDGIPKAVLLPVLLTVAIDREVQRLGQGIHDRHADTVETAGNLVRRIVEFPAGM
jgi:hypothetical protein